MDLLQLLILLTITGICGALAVFALGFSPRGVMILLFSIIAGTIGAAVGSWLKGFFRIPDLWAIKIGTLRLDIVLTLLGAIAVVGLLMGLQALLVRTDQRTSNAQKEGH